MLKRKKKTKQERVVEEYFPVDESDTKLAIEKKVDEPKIEKVIGSIDDSEKIEIKEKSKTILKNKKTQKRIRKKFTPPKVSLKKNSYELIITEKPQAATKIATSLGNATQKILNKVYYYEVERQGKKIIVACAVGHLLTLDQNTPNQKIPVFDISWFPNYLVRKNDFTKKYYDVISKLSKEAGSLTVATDYDIEGEVIGLNIIRFICGQQDAARMKFSTLTTQDLNQAYENKLPSLNWAQGIAGETRHYLDWYYGINLSRALMNSIQTTGSFKIMSVGRVQGPTLNLIVQKEKEIKAFKPKPYWQVFITISDGKNKVELKYIKDIFDKKKLRIFEGIKGKRAQTETKKIEQILPPQAPFNLTTLQTEAYKFYGTTPSKTIQIAQSLYLSGLISYPRTSSQKLPPSINYKPILEKLAKKYKVENLITKNKPIEGKKTDPAHPSIYPTGQIQILSGNDEKIYNLIAKRFLSLFCDNAIVDNKTIKAKIDDMVFSVRGSLIRKKAWLEIYPSKMKQTQLPDIEGEVTIIDLKTEEKITQPPKRYSPASIISELEKRNLGTKATRASIIETLYDRGYIKGQSIEATPLGISLIETLEKYSPIIIDEKLTRRFEQQMDSIQTAKKNLEDKERKITKEAKGTIIEIAKNFSKNEIKIGKELLDANKNYWAQQKIENTIMKCPKCKEGNLFINYSKRFKRHFVACDAYPECKTTFSLPPNGIIKKTDKICEKCGFPILMRLSKGKKPWFFCFNSNCETNKERIEKYKENKIRKEN